MTRLGLAQAVADAQAVHAHLVAAIDQVGAAAAEAHALAADLDRLADSEIRATSPV